MNPTMIVTLPPRPAVSYPITIGHRLLEQWQEWLPPCALEYKLVVISDSQVGALYGQPLVTKLQQAGYEVRLLTFAAGEQAKTAASKLKLEEQMFEFGCDRHTLCLALGGGVVGDLAGFTAATFMRGLKYFQIPTSLLAMIDSSVGGKTAVNTSYGKNTVGAFWQPQAVIMDVAVLTSLGQTQLINGLFEAVKIFLTSKLEMFNYCQQHLEQILALEAEPLIKVISSAVALKAHIVEQDEQEQNLRMILNYGHSVGHAIEKVSNYQVLHGFAVALGMLVEAKIANRLGLLTTSEYMQIAALLNRLGVNPAQLTAYSSADLLTAMRGDKKNSNQTIVMVLLTAVGQVKNIDNQVAFPVAETIIVDVLTELSKG